MMRPKGRGRVVVPVLVALSVIAVGAAARFVWIGPHPMRRTAPTQAARSTAAPLDAMVLVPASRFTMGNDRSTNPAERPAHEVVLPAFLLDACEVTNRQFEQFVRETSYVTTAEQRGRAMVFDTTEHRWTEVKGADWRHPRGPDFTIDGRGDYPVVQVSWYDARAYAAWCGKRLPTEAEWEAAARGGLRDVDFPWGREERPGGRYQANYWQGWFPDEDLGLDGFRELAEVGSYPANRAGLYDIVGNVWEWCADGYDERYYADSPEQSPQGPADRRERVCRGGSWMSAENSGRGFTVSAREPFPPEASYAHLGFRCARDAGEPRQRGVGSQVSTAGTDGVAVMAMGFGSPQPYWRP